MGKHHVSPVDHLNNNHLYRGNENDIVLSRIFTTKFICEYQLVQYPFDTQVCEMVFVMQVSTHHTVYTLSLMCLQHMFCYRVQQGQLLT